MDTSMMMMNINIYAIQVAKEYILTSSGTFSFTFGCPRAHPSNLTGLHTGSHLTALWWKYSTLFRFRWVLLHSASKRNSHLTLDCSSLSEQSRRRGKIWKYVGIWWNKSPFCTKNMMKYIYIFIYEHSPFQKIIEMLRTNSSTHFGNPTCQILHKYSTNLEILRSLFVPQNNMFIL